MELKYLESCPCGELYICSINLFYSFKNFKHLREHLFQFSSNHGVTLMTLGLNFKFKDQLLAHFFICQCEQEQNIQQDYVDQDFDLEQVGNFLAIPSNLNQNMDLQVGLRKHISLIVMKPFFKLVSPLIPLCIFVLMTKIISIWTNHSLID